MKGFANIGNTCYLNAGLQMLIQNNDLCDLILNFSNKSNTLKIIANFIQDYYSSDNNVMIPKDIKTLVEKNQEIFIGYKQHDSTEFIICLLNIIDEEILNINKSVNLIDNSEYGISSIFGIEFNLKIKCKYVDCLKIYDKKEINNFLFIELNSDIKCLDDGYRKLKMSEKLNNDNKYFCIKCNQKQIASKSYQIIKWPKYLFIMFKRFGKNGSNLSKNSQELDIPLKWRHDMELQSAVIHSGSIDGGHYYYIGKVNNKWYMFNDSSVSEIANYNEVKRNLSHAYYLCYKKILI